MLKILRRSYLLCPKNGSENCFSDYLLILCNYVLKKLCMEEDLKMETKLLSTSFQI